MYSLKDYIKVLDRMKKVGGGFIRHRQRIGWTPFQFGKTGRF